MATLSQGQTTSIQLAEGESWTVTPAGQAQVSSRGLSGNSLSAPTTISVATTFGPYTETGVLTIASIAGTTTYAQAGGAVYQDPTTGALLSGSTTVYSPGIGAYVNQILRPGFTPARIIATGADGNGVAGGWGATNGNLSTETVDVLRPGTSVVKCTWTGSGTMSLRHKIPSTALSGKFEIKIKMSTPSAGSGFWYFKWSATAPAADPPTTAPAGTHNINISSTERADGQWTTLSFNPPTNRFSTGNLAGRAWTDTEGLPSVVQYIEISCDWSGSPAAESYCLVDIVAINGYTKPMCVIGFDGAGAYPNVNTFALPLFRNYGIAGYMSGSASTMQTNSANCQALYDAGWDLIHQALRSTNDYAANSANLASDIVAAKQIMTSMGWTRTNMQRMMTMPSNSRNATTDSIQAANDIVLSVATNQSLTPHSQLVNANLRTIGRHSLNGNAGTGTNAQNALASAISEGSHIWFYGHNPVSSITDSSTQILQSEFSAFLAYAADKHYAGQIEIVTPTQFYARIAGAV